MSEEAVNLIVVTIGFVPPLLICVADYREQRRRAEQWRLFESLMEGSKEPRHLAVEGKDGLWREIF